MVDAGLFFDSVKEVPSENKRRETSSPTPPKFCRNQIEDLKLVKETGKSRQTTHEITGDRRENTSAPTTSATPPVAADNRRTGSATGGLLPAQGVTLAAAGNGRRYSLEGGEERQSAAVCENFRKLVEEKISEKSEEEFYDSFLSRPSSTFTSSLLVGASSSGSAVHSSSVAQSVVSKPKWPFFTTDIC